jgi:hypothetical protein
MAVGVERHRTLAVFEKIVLDLRRNASHGIHAPPHQPAGGVVPVLDRSGPCRASEVLDLHQLVAMIPGITLVEDVAGEQPALGEVPLVVVNVAVGGVLGEAILRVGRVRIRVRTAAGLRGGRPIAVGVEGVTGVAAREARIETGQLPRPVVGKILRLGIGENGSAGKGGQARVPADLRLADAVGGVVGVIEVDQERGTGRPVGPACGARIAAARVMINFF